MKNSLIGLLTVVVLIGMTTNAFCGEKIEGAFGLKLGDIFDPATAVSTTGGDEDAPPTPIKFWLGNMKPSAGFSEFFVVITPKTHRIFCIGGIRDETREIEMEIEILENTLREKYTTDDLTNLPRYLTGDGTYLMPDYLVPGKVVVYQKTRDIMLTRLGGRPGQLVRSPSGPVSLPSGRGKLQITYIDRDLEKSAEREAVELRLKGKSDL